MEELISCKICGHSTPQSLQAHIKHKHSLSNQEYKNQFPDASIYSKVYSDRLRYTNAHRDPVYKQKISENTKKLNADKEWVERHRVALKKGQNTPEAQKKHKEGALRYFSCRTDEQIREQKVRAQLSWTKPETRKNRVEALKTAHSSGAVRASHSEATKKFYRELTLEQRQEIKDTLKETWKKPHLREKILKLSKYGLERAMSPEGVKNRILSNLKPEVREKRRQVALKRLSKQPKRSSLNFKFEKALNDAGLFPDPEHTVYPYMVDFCFPEQRLIVEVDGDYWHGNPSKYTEFDKIQTKTINKDKREASFCKSQNWTLFRFWETDINKDINACIKEVQEALNGQ